MSATVQKGIEAVERADQEQQVPPSREVEAQRRIDDAERKKAAAKKPTPDPKYTDDAKALAKRAREIRGKANAVAPVTCQRVEALLRKRKTDADAVVKMFKTVKEATEYAGGSKEVAAPDALKELGTHTTDPFARGRGLVSVCLAMREATKK
jgi:uncharacterized coiled-coil DUF342 family protein